MARGGTLLISLALALASAASDAGADTAFTKESLLGHYGFSAQGSIKVVNPDGTVTDIGPAVAVGLFAFDGMGGCTITDTLNVGLIGPIGPRLSTACSYSVNADGTGTLTAEFGPPLNGTVPLSFVIADNRKELRFIRTDLGAVAVGVASRQ